MTAPSSSVQRLRNGPLRVWIEPEPGQKYILAADTAGGSANGDFAAAIVLRAEDCGFCAAWHGQEEPNSFGRKLARLGWFYNTALLAVETFPSATGVHAIKAAEQLGYKNVYTFIGTDTVTNRQTKHLGWRTNAQTKPRMVSRIQQALEEGDGIPCEELQQELRSQRYDQNRKIFCEGHDDLMDTYGIALMVRDDAWYRSALRPDRARPMNEHERVWASMGVGPEKPKLRMVM